MENCIGSLCKSAKGFIDVAAFARELHSVSIRSSWVFFRPCSPLRSLSFLFLCLPPSLPCICLILIMCSFKTSSPFFLVWIMWLSKERELLKFQGFSIWLILVFLIITASNFKTIFLTSALFYEIFSSSPPHPLF